MPLSTPPSSLFDAHGVPCFGIWQGYGPRADAHDFEGFRSGRLNRRFTEKRWQYLGFSHLDHFIGLAVVNVGYLGTGWLYHYDRRRNTLRQWQRKSLLARDLTTGDDPCTSPFAFDTPGFSVRITADTANTQRTAVVDVSGPAGRLAGDLVIRDDGSQALGFLGPQKGGRFNLTYKTAGLPASGSVQMEGGDRIDLAQDRTRAHVDWTWGCPPRVTTWNWAACSGVLPDGRSFGFNFGSGLNEGAFYQNVLWIDGLLSPLRKVHFHYDPRDIMRPWRLLDDEGRVDLRFDPFGQRGENINVLVIQSRFKQPFGSYFGKVVGDDGCPVHLDGLGGVAEEHFARW